MISAGANSGIVVGTVLETREYSPAMAEGRNGGDLLKRESRKYFLGWKGVSEPLPAEPGLSLGKAGGGSTTATLTKMSLRRHRIDGSVALVRGDLV